MMDKIRELEVFSKQVSVINGPYITNAALDVKLLLAYLLKCDVDQLRNYYEDGITKSLASEFQSYFLRRQEGEPVSKIIGTKAFWNNMFKVSEDTLDPRPDSEILVEAILSILLDQDRAYHILDLGTGTGCLLLTLVSELQNATGIGVDISEKALNIAKENADMLALDSRVEFSQSNWFETVSGKFDLIISNPPYIVEKDIFSLSLEVKKHDPMLALNGGKDGLDAYRVIISNLSNYLKEDGLFCFEIGFDQATLVSELLKENGFKHFRVIKDYAQMDRCIIGEAKR